MLRWRKVRTVIRREYQSRVHTKAFWISTLLVPVVMLVFSLGPTLLTERTGGSYTVALVTANSRLADLVAAKLRATAHDDRSRGAALVITAERIAPAKGAAAQRKELKRAVLAKKFSAVVILPEDVGSATTLEYLSTNVTAFRVIERVEKAIQAAIVEGKLIAAGLPEQRVAALTKAPGLVPIRIANDLTETDESSMQSFALSYVLMFLLFFTVMIYGFYVMRSVLEEKTSRIVEVIVANLSPHELMVGKILGVGAVGLTQYAIWVVVAMNLAVPGVIPHLLGTTGIAISPVLLVYFVAFFLCGYALYATLYAALGAFFNSEEEAQQMQSVIGWLMAVPFLLIIPIMNNPNSTLSTVVSLVPFFSPMLFFLRISVQTPPVWQTLLCFALLAAAIVLVARFAAIVYRIGILTVGKRPTVREVLGWLREG
jgi:ABC-2 type transport system permease protein